MPTVAVRTLRAEQTMSQILRISTAPIFRPLLESARYKAAYGGKSSTFQPDEAKPLEFDVPAGTAKAMVEIVRS